ncbi:MAG: HdeD family acid-resistance protein [Caulobacteraceae bacterium]
MATTHPHATPSGSVRFGKAPWWTLAIEGVVLIAVGLLAAFAPFLASIALAVFVGWMFFLGGVVRLASTLIHRGPGFVWSLIMGLLAIAAGVVLALWPLVGVISLTIILAAFFVADAVSSFFLAATLKRHASRARWLVVSGIADLVLGGVIFFGLNQGALWLLGFVAAVYFVFTGAGLVTIGLTCRARGGA